MRKSSGCVRGKIIKGNSSSSGSNTRTEVPTNKQTKNEKKTFQTNKKYAMHKKKGKKTKSKQNIEENYEVVRLNLFCCRNFSYDTCYA